MSLFVTDQIIPLQSWLKSKRDAGHSIGFVPTMGALHEGHMSLIRRALTENQTVVVSIFVNPTQFNNPQDLLLYPRTLASDVEMIENAGGHAVFAPETNEMYPKKEKGHWDFGSLSHNLEGHYRPGHFDGVLTIVKKLFAVVQPDKAYFGEKDFQQLALIKKLVHSEHIPVKIVACPSVRETNGLAMSSRNRRLNPQQLLAAAEISRVLGEMKSRKSEMAPEDLEAFGKKEIEKINGLRLEYLSVADSETLEPITEWNNLNAPVVLIAVYAGEVRLIDNLRL